MSENYAMANNGSAEVSEKLKRLIETVDVANMLTEPLTSSISKLLSVAAAEIDSEEASVLVRDGDQGDLRFLVAIGKVAEQLIDLKVPAGKGIAGFVMSSGQPMAVADVGEEQSFYDEVDKTTGFSTQTILATPLRHNDEVIGVLEFINRCGDPPYRPFTPDEMDKAALCAEAVASLVNAYEKAKMFRDLGDKLLSDSGETDLDDVRAWLGDLRESAEHKETMYLAVLLRDISSRGEAERAMCREVLESLHRYAKTLDDTGYVGY